MFFKLAENQDLRIIITTPLRGPFELPAVYATPEAQGVIRGYVEFNALEEVKAKDLTLNFRVKSRARWVRHYGESTVVYNSKEILQKKQWQIPLKYTRPGLVSAGAIRYDFEVELNPFTPSSIHGQRAWLTYRFAVELKRAFPHRNVAKTQDVWVFSSCLPSPSLDYMPAPHSYTGVWETHLPFTCSIPNENVSLGERMPLTVEFQPFLDSSGHKGESLVIVSAVVKLKQYTRLWHRWNVKNETKELFSIPLNSEWPEVANGFQRTIHIDIPYAPRLSCTTMTRPVRKTHRLKLIMKVKTNSMTDKQARELRVESKCSYAATSGLSTFRQLN
ncbi:hypothetical protein BGW38_004711 [Lunasporangiospora selenospora]|uniref:Arrestin-like N-terminal domain-containing protein n=1 Tax=Lunasporangiospora selenospora TaxID=979761 RepID=A0A9P6KIQ1_9FUNG|nr:hypothetical protein BGW38_004711 [Lunasporangiospora selenospora]